jgi:hypothetical protein
VLGQPLIEHGEIGVHHVGDAQVLLQHFAKERPRLGEHGVPQNPIKFGIQPLVGRGRVDVAQVEPLVGEVGLKTLRLGVS